MRLLWRLVAGFWLVALALGSLGLPAVHAQDVETTRARVQQWLLRELGKPGLILVQYSFSGTTWPDSSLGCPAEGKTYAQEEVSGYRWLFEFDNRVRYEVHSSFDGSAAVLCSSLNVAPDVRLTSYKTRTFTILIPVAWLIFPNEDQTEVLFGPQQADQCDQPGMRVTALGRVATGVTPDQIIDDYLGELGTSDDATTDRSTVGTYGRSTVFQTVCGSTSRWWRLSTFVQYGSAYRVEQWAPVNVFPEWDASFLQMLSQFGPPDAAFSAESGTAVAPDGSVEMAALPPLPLAHMFMQDVFLATLNDIPGRSITANPQVERRYLAFSPDGLYVSYLDATDGRLRVLDAAEGLSPRRLADDAYAAFPPTWSPDSLRLAYAVATDRTDTDGLPLVDIVALPRDGGDPETLGAFPFDSTCLAEPSDPADDPYFLEAGAGGADNVLVWMTGDRFLVSTQCAGGLGLLDVAAATITALPGDLRGGVPSPDRTQVLSHNDNGLVLLDFESWERTNLNVGPNVTQVAWGADGETVYYSTETLVDSVTLDDPADSARGAEVFGFWPVTVGVYDVALYRVDLVSNQKTLLWRGPGRGIGRISAAPDGSGVLFSLIPSSLLVSEAFQARSDPLAVREAWPAPSLYWLPVDSPTATLLAYSGQPVFAPVSVNAG